MISATSQIYDPYKLMIVFGYLQISWGMIIVDARLDAWTTIH
jgi:hypothetical protein